MKLLLRLCITSLILVSCQKKQAETPIPSGQQEQIETSVPSSQQEEKPAVQENLVHIENDGKFESYFTKTDRLLVLDLYADWCGPCKMIAPDFAALSGEYGDRADFLKINVDNNPKLAERFKANSIPLVLIIKNGKTLEKVVGSRGKEEYRKLIVKHLN